MDNCLGNCEWCRDTRSATENKQLWSLTLCQSIFAFYFILQWHMKWKIIKFNEKFLHASQHCNTNRFSLDSRIWFKRNSMPVQCRLNGTLAVYFDFFRVAFLLFSLNGLLLQLCSVDFRSFGMITQVKVKLKKNRFKRGSMHPRNSLCDLFYCHVSFIEAWLLSQNRDRHRAKIERVTEIKSVRPVINLCFNLLIPVHIRIDQVQSGLIFHFWEY